MDGCRCRLYLFINLTIIFVYPFAAHSCTRLPLICFILLFLFVAPFAAYSCTRVPLIVCRWISKFNAFRNPPRPFASGRVDPEYKAT